MQVFPLAIAMRKTVNYFFKRIKQENGSQWLPFFVGDEVTMFATGKVTNER